MVDKDGSMLGINMATSMQLMLGHVAAFGYRDHPRLIHAVIALITAFACISGVVVQKNCFEPTPYSCPATTT